MIGLLDSLFTPWVLYGAWAGWWLVSVAHKHQRREADRAERADQAMWESALLGPAPAPLDWCEGCGRTPESCHMAWTDDGLYRCPACRATTAVQTSMQSWFPGEAHFA